MTARRLEGKRGYRDGSLPDEPSRALTSGIIREHWRRRHREAMVAAIAHHTASH
jgi:hypothetical protein